MAWSADGKRLAVSIRRIVNREGKVVAPTPENSRLGLRASYSVQIWDVAAGRLARTLNGADGNDLVVRGFAPDGATVAISHFALSNGKSVEKLEFWSVAQGELKDSLMLDATISEWVLSPDGKTLAVWRRMAPAAGQPSATTAYTAQLLDAHTGTVLKELPHSYQSTLSRIPGFGANNSGALAFSAAGTKLATADTDKAVLWSAPDGKKVRELKNWRGRDFPVTGTLVFGGDGASLFRVGFSLAAWDVKTGAFKHRWTSVTAASFGVERRHSILRATTSRQGKLVALTGLGRPKNASDVYLWDARTDRFLHSWHRAGNATGAVLFAPDGRSLAIANADSTITLWPVGGKK
jgi:WD40 repeat protein